jgi:hypothetical protein
MKEIIYVVCLNISDSYDIVDKKVLFATRDKEKAEKYVEKANNTFIKLNTWRNCGEYVKMCNEIGYLDNVYRNVECEIIKTNLE